MIFRAHVLTSRHVNDSDEEDDSNKPFYYRKKCTVLHFYIAGVKDLSSWRVRR